MTRYKQGNRRDYRNGYRGVKECSRQKNKDIGSAVWMNILAQTDEKKKEGWLKMRLEK